MVFNPRWNAQFAKPLLNQIIALIQRDQAAAIPMVNSALKPINEFHKARLARVAFPWLLVWISQNVMDVESDHTRTQDIDGHVAVEVGYIDQENAQDQAHDYARVIDMIVESAVSADWETSLPITFKGTQSMTVPPVPGSVKRAQVVAHHVDAIMVEGYTNPAVRATITIKFLLEET
jgi:lantibiotic modifying enzyme